MTPLICPECQRENEAERIFCHGCGARLDRSVLVAQKPKGERPEQAHRRLQRMLDPQRGKLRRLFFTFAKMVLAAAAAAALAEIALPPNVPPPTSRTGVPPEINFDLEKAIVGHQPAQFQYTQEDVNAYLTYALKSKQASLNKPLLIFKRVIVELGENNKCTITMERSLFGYSLFQRASYQVQLNDGKISTEDKGCWLGRLPIDPRAMKLGDSLFADLWAALDRERKLVAKMGGLEMHNGTVTLSTSPSQ